MQTETSQDKLSDACSYLRIGLYEVRKRYNAVLREQDECRGALNATNISLNEISYYNSIGLDEVDVSQWLERISLLSDKLEGFKRKIEATSKNLASNNHAADDVQESMISYAKEFKLGDRDDILKKLVQLGELNSLINDKLRNTAIFKKDLELKEYELHKGLKECKNLNENNASNLNKIKSMELIFGLRKEINISEELIEAQDRELTSAYNTIINVGGVLNTLMGLKEAAERKLEESKTLAEIEKVQEGIDELSLQLKQVLPIQTEQDKIRVSDLIKQIIKGLQTGTSQDKLSDAGSYLRIGLYEVNKRYNAVLREQDKCRGALNSIETFLCEISRYKSIGLDEVDVSQWPEKISKLSAILEECKEEIEDTGKVLSKVNNLADDVQESMIPYAKEFKLGDQDDIIEKLIKLEELNSKINDELLKTNRLQEVIVLKKEKLNICLEEYKSLNVNNPSNLNKIELMESMFELGDEINIGDKLIKAQSREITSAYDTIYNLGMRLNTLRDQSEAADREKLTASQTLEGDEHCAEHVL